MPAAIRITAARDPRRARRPGRGGQGSWASTRVPGADARSSCRWPAGHRPRRQPDDHAGPLDGRHHRARSTPRASAVTIIRALQQVERRRGLRCRDRDRDPRDHLRPHDEHGAGDRATARPATKDAAARRRREPPDGDRDRCGRHRGRRGPDLSDPEFPDGDRLLVPGPVNAISTGSRTNLLRHHRRIKNVVSVRPDQPDPGGADDVTVVARRRLRRSWRSPCSSAGSGRPRSRPDLPAGAHRGARALAAQHGDADAGPRRDGCRRSVSGSGWGSSRPATRGSRRGSDRSSTLAQTMPSFVYLMPAVALFGATPLHRDRGRA